MKKLTSGEIDWTHDTQVCAVVIIKSGTVAHKSSSLPIYVDHDRFDVADFSYSNEFNYTVYREDAQTEKPTQEEADIDAQIAAGAVIGKLVAGDEWSNGDKCVWKHGHGSGVFVGLLPCDNTIAVVSQGAFTFNMNIEEMSRPLTAEQKAAKEREESAKAIFLLKTNKRKEVYKDNYLAHTWENVRDEEKEICRLLVDAGVKLPK